MDAKLDHPGVCLATARNVTQTGKTARAARRANATPSRSGGIQPPVAKRGTRRNGGVALPVAQRGSSYRPKTEDQKT